MSRRPMGPVRARSIGDAPADVDYFGSTLAVGAYAEASNATRIGGNQADNSASTAGAVYIY